LERFRITDNAICQCGHPRQDPRHLILFCPMYSIQRKQIRKGIKGPLTIGILLGTKSRIELTIKFLKDTRISTREWIAEGNEEGEEN
jgi:hypothetical protein